jgi:uncharacterized protein YndB with AHSA1/START domain
MDNNVDPIVVEQTFDAPLAVVWKALTDQGQMRQWFFEAMTDFRPETGFETQFNVRCENRDYLHIWKVTDVVPGEKIAYGWRYAGYRGDSTVVWELSKTPNGTKLSLTHQGHETFPQDDPAFSWESCRAGWEYFVRESLKAFLAGQST